MSIESLFETAEPKGGKSVLVVDDSSMMRHVVSQIVTQLGHRAIEAIDGEDALAKARESLPDLIVLDVDMPKKNGVEFLKELRAKAGFVSDAGDHADRAQGPEHHERGGAPEGQRLSG